MKHLITAICIGASVILLAACGTTDKIANGKVSAVKADVVSTKHHEKMWFTMMPMPIYNGKSTIIRLVPMWHEDKTVTIHYRFDGKKYSVKTSDFQVKQHDGNQYIKIRRKDIGKRDVPVVLYTHD